MKTKYPPIISLAILTTIVSMFWLSFTVYRTFSKKPDPEVSEEILKPVNPRLDSKSLDQLNDRFYIDEESISEIKINVAEKTPLPTPQSIIQKTPAPQSSPVPTFSPENESTPSASPVVSQ